MLEYYDNTENVILLRKNKSEVVFPHSLFRPFRSRQRVRISESVFPSFSAHWYLPKEEGLPVPLPGEEIIDNDDNCWQILEVHPSPMNHNWQITARCYFVPFGLDDYFDLLRMVSIKTPDGTMKDGYVPVRCGIAARFADPYIVFDLDNKIKKETVYVLCREPVEADTDNLVRLANGKMYSIEKIKTGVFTEIRLVNL